MCKILKRSQDNQGKTSQMEDEVSQTLYYTQYVVLHSTKMCYALSEIAVPGCIYILSQTYICFHQVSNLLFNSTLLQSNSCIESVFCLEFGLLLSLGRVPCLHLCLSHPRFSSKKKVKRVALNVFDFMTPLFLFFPFIFLSILHS